MNNMNELATKDELINAGFCEAGPFHTAILICEVFKIYITTNGIDKGFITINDPDKDKHIKTFKATKQNLSDAYEFFTGNPLDFSPKEKRYDWESVRDELPRSVISSINDAIDEINRLDNEALSKKLVAILKLEYIIEAINRDFPSDDKYGHAVLENGNNELMTFTCEKMLKDMYTISVNPAGSDVLLKYNEQLLKDALKCN